MEEGFKYGAVDGQHRICVLRGEEFQQIKTVPAVILKPELSDSPRALARISAALNVNAQSAIVDSLYGRIRRLQKGLHQLKKDLGREPKQEDMKTYFPDSDSFTKTAEVSHYKAVLRRCEQFDWLMDMLKFENDVIPQKKHRLNLTCLHHGNIATLETLVTKQRVSKEFFEKVLRLYVDLIAPDFETLNLPLNTQELLGWAKSKDHSSFPDALVRGKEQTKTFFYRCCLAVWATEKIETALRYVTTRLLVMNTQHASVVQVSSATRFKSS